MRKNFRTHGRACITLRCGCDKAREILQARADRPVDVNVHPVPRPLPERRKASLKRPSDTWPGRP